MVPSPYDNGAGCAARKEGKGRLGNCEPSEEALTCNTQMWWSMERAMQKELLHGPLFEGNTVGEGHHVARAHREKAHRTRRKTRSYDTARESQEEKGAHFHHYYST